MDKKALGIIAVLGAAAAGIAIAKAAAAKEVPVAKYTCVWKDGFTADTWEKMLEHYSTVHPGMNVLDYVEIQWV